MKPLRTALIGHPVAQSLSPFIHDYWRRAYGVAGSYELIDTGGAAHLSAKIKELVAQDYSGFNVTLPHKAAMLEYCDHIDESARQSGAVNCVTIKDGKTHGSNTDGYGFLQSLRERAPGDDFLKGKIVILGAGGAARAVIHILRTAGAARIIICNRTIEKARALCMEVAGWERRDEILAGARLLVNTTCLGMAGKEGLVIDLAALPKNALVCDIVYKPLETDLLAQAKKRGHLIVDGLGMLLHQAALSFSLWTGIMPEVDDELRGLLVARAAL